MTNQESENVVIGRKFLLLALILLGLGLFFGVIASQTYLIPDFLKDSLNFPKTRPLHVSSVLFWILIASIGSIYCGLELVAEKPVSKILVNTQFGLLIFALIGIIISYFTNNFGGKEYWEFPPILAIPIVLSFILFLINYLKATLAMKDWPVYQWMWLTGISFFIYTFSEAYLWMIPYFGTDIVKDMTVQWKSSGSLVGSWNQMVYGTGLFLMERISGNKEFSRSRLAFSIYFLGLFNLMFNWGHHIYTLPTQPYVRIVSYTVSMTEWILLARIIYNWRQSLAESKKLFHNLSYKFIVASDYWIGLNLLLAILLSIPALNLYSHGTHLTVAHSMGTTIGINSMILFASCFYFIGTKYSVDQSNKKVFDFAFWSAQISLFIFWLALIIAGIKRGLWQMSPDQIPFREMMDSLSPYFTVFIITGILLSLSLFTLIYILIRGYLKYKFLYFIDDEGNEVEDVQEQSN